MAYTLHSDVRSGSSPDHSVINEVKLSSSNSDQQELKRTPEDSIPVIEIKGEGKPMVRFGKFAHGHRFHCFPFESSAQIRHLEEVSNGGPLDIKVVPFHLLKSHTQLLYRSTRRGCPPFVLERLSA